MKVRCKEPPEVILARKPLCFPNGRGGGAVKQKGTVLSQNEGGRSGEPYSRRTQNSKDTQDHSAALGSLRQWCRS